MKLVYLLAFTFFGMNGYSQDLQPDQKAEISNFIAAVKTRDFQKLIPFFSFPIEREYPLPDIKNEVEFINRYDELFDDSITALIVNSDPNKDWKIVGWRGFMLNSGDLWMSDTDYKIIRVNAQSKAERETRKEIIRYDKSVIHESLREFEAPILVLETSKYMVRIDALKDDLYRYAAWPLNASISEKPDLINKEGTLEYQGSGGNHQYQFTNGEFVYTLRINYVGTEDMAPATLIVEKSGVEILSQPAQFVRN